MIEKSFVSLGKQLFKLRYDLTVTGLDTLEKKRPDRGILFLPNHPALIDPLLVSAVLYDKFCPRPLADEKQMDRPLLKRVLTKIRPIYLPDVRTAGRAGTGRAAAAVSEVAEALAVGDNVLLYPSGAMMRQKHERLGANSAVAEILGRVDEVQIVLVRITGLWGSSFSWASGKAPELTGQLKRYAASVLAGGIFFVPKRAVSIEFFTPDDFPYGNDKKQINQYLESFYETAARPALHVPYFLGRKATELPEPDLATPTDRDIESVSPEIRKTVDEKLMEMTGVQTVSPADKLAADIGLDSLSVVAFMTWIEQEFGLPQEDASRLLTVSDCYVAAAGALPQTSETTLTPIDRRWFEDRGNEPLAVSTGQKLTDLFLEQAGRHPNLVIIGDQLRGEKTYRDLVTAILALGTVFKGYEEKHVGLMLPASGTAAIVYFALLFAGKVPVLVNWTVGARHLKHSLGTVGVRRVLTAEALLVRLQKLGLDYSDIGADFVPLEGLGKQISTFSKVQSAAKARLSWSALRNAPVDDIAAILFTSGSESTPKTVPLTHDNLLSNMRDYLSIMKLHEDDRVLGILPPFHSFGLAGTIVMPLCSGLPTVYHANPTEGAQIAKLTAAYKPTFALMTPTFLSNIVDAAPKGALSSLKKVVTGAEKCPDALQAAFKTVCPAAILIEGYGITECSPVVSANDPEDPHQGTIGKIMPSMSHLIVHPESGEPVTVPDQSGRLLVKGPNIFSGYIGHDGPSPFVIRDGEKWYDTGDIVSQDMNGVLTFQGRLKRFIKLAGEMISLPAIETALFQSFAEGGEITLAVGATTADPPETVLFTTLPITRAAANKVISNAGLSPLHSIRKVVKVAEIPTLGSGKTDHRALSDLLKPEV